jgi:hypothetical protein
MKKKYLVCVGNKGYEASLEVRKIYEVIPDSQAKRFDQLRVIDESGEDYLFPESLFAPITVPEKTKELITV